jgi:hypothetical protein
MFYKGQSGNPKGRPKGKPTRIKTDLAEKVAMLVNNNFVQLQQDIDALEPRERVKAILGLLQYVLPKIQATTEAERIAAEYEQLNKLIQSSSDCLIDEIYNRFEKVREYNEQTG